MTVIIQFVKILTTVLIAAKVTYSNSMSGHVKLRFFLSYKVERFCDSRVDSILIYQAQYCVLFCDFY